MCYSVNYELWIFYRGKNLNQADGWPSAWYVFYLSNFCMILEQILYPFVDIHVYSDPSKKFILPKNSSNQLYI